MPFGIENIHCDYDVVIVITKLGHNFHIEPQKVLPEEVSAQIMELNSVVGWSCRWLDVFNAYSVWIPKSLEVVSAAERIAIGLEETGLKVKRLHLRKECQSFILA